MKLFYDKRPSRLNPHMCNLCENFAEKYQGGAEVESSLLFADVRGSTTIAEGMSPSDFGKLIDRFYKAVSAVLIHSDALIDKLIGDQAAGIYVPGFAGPDHARRAIEAAQKVLQVTGHNDTSGPWIPLGVGVHTGIAFVGSVGSKDATTDITVLGDAPNTAARLSSNAEAGEILVSKSASEAAGLNVDQLEGRLLELKGKTEPVSVYSLTGPTSLNFSG
jgi:adenylate cyclase